VHAELVEDTLAASAVTIAVSDSSLEKSGKRVWRRQGLEIRAAGNKLG